MDAKSKKKSKKNTGKTETKVNWHLLLPVLCAIGVFGYWYFLKPFMLLVREQSQLFLFTRDYLLERLAVPGGLAQYIGEFLVQFFALPLYGSIIYALLFLLAWWLSWRLLRKVRFGFPLSFIVPLVLFYLSTNIYVPLTPTVAILSSMALLMVLPKKKNVRLPLLFILIPVAYWLLGPAVVILLFGAGLRWSPLVAVVLAACIVGSSRLVPYPLRQVALGIDYYWQEKHLGTEEEMEIDMLMRMKNWKRLDKRASEMTSPSLAVRSAGALAQFQLRQIGEYELQQALAVTNKALNSQPSAFILSELYMCTGLINMAGRAAFEGMESVPNYNKSGRALRRLVETNLISGQTDVALKYLSILDHTLLLRSWSKKMRPLAEHPELIDSHPVYGPLKKTHSQAKDVFFY